MADEAAEDGGAEIGAQEARELRIDAEQQYREMQYALHVLRQFTRRPDGDEVFGRPECQELREEISLLASQFGRKLRLQTGDRRYDGNVVGEGGVDGNPNRDELSIDFVKSIAEQEGEDDVDDLPLLQVYANDIAFETNAARNRSSSIHFTNARLLDGSGDTILGRFSMNLAQDGHKLNGGDIIRLDRFTPMTYANNGLNSETRRMPAVVIHSFTSMGFLSLPTQINNPIQCLNAAEIIERRTRPETTTKDDGNYERLVEVECTPDNRYCSRYGVSMVTCICESDPVRLINMEELANYCYYATKQYSNMDNGDKRFMLYWWYMTNTYNICGKGQRKEVPPCLLAAIRKAYPSADGWYKIFDPNGGGSTGSKKKKRS